MSSSSTVAMFWGCVVALFLVVAAEDHQIQKRDVAQVCMGPLGCFGRDKDFQNVLYRPINLLPADRESINTKFLLYTRNNSKQFELIRNQNKKDVDNSFFDGKRVTKFIIHGYMDTQIFGEWMRTMMKEFLIHGDYNVFIVDWSGGNGLPYTQATSNTRVVGAEIAVLVQFLRDNYGLNVENVHILGHSLGAHVAGYAGERVPGLGRITGMDPAEPYFQNMPPNVRLDATDADFVDVIHTDASTDLGHMKMGLGMSQLVGHVDFFPNNGKDHPGCTNIETGIKIFTEGLAEGARRFVSCNHQRSVDFMTDSLNNVQCQPLSFACSSWESYLEGKCISCGEKNDQCAVMGIRAIDHEPYSRENQTKKFYTLTAAATPFCAFQYQIAVKFQGDVGKERSGSLKIIVDGRKRAETFDLSIGNVDLTPGQTFTHLVSTSKDLGQIEGVSLSWKTSSLITGFVFKQFIYVESVTVNPVNELDTNIREGLSRKFCVPKGKNEVQSGDAVTMDLANKC